MKKVIIGIVLIGGMTGCTRQSLESSVIALKMVSSDEETREHWRDIAIEKGYQEEDPFEAQLEELERIEAQAESLYPYANRDEIGNTTPALASGRTFLPRPKKPPVYDEKNPFPALSGGFNVEGFTQYDLQIAHANELVTHVLLYVPEHSDVSKLGCILLPPGGSDLTMGMHLAQEDMIEHLPYLDCNLIVAAFSISGGGAPSKRWPGANERREYFKAVGGIADGQKTLDFVLHHFPKLDQKRVYVAGHHSGGTLAIQLTAYEPRITGCLAYAPVTYYSKYMDMAYKVSAYNSIRDFSGFIYDHEPGQLEEKVKVPTFVYHSEGDGLVLIAQNKRFTGKLRQAGGDVTFVTGEGGQHYESVYNEGIPAGIDWINQQAKKSGKGKKKS